MEKGRDGRGWKKRELDETKNDQKTAKQSKPTKDTRTRMRADLQ